MQEKIGIIGLGNMGVSMADILSKSYEVHAYDIDSANKKMSHILRKRMIIHDNMESFNHTNCITIIAVKPPNVLEVVQAIKHDNPLISIAAGVSVHQIQTYKQKDIPIIRAMPNTPFKIGKGTTCIFVNQYTTPEQVKKCVEILSKGGRVFKISKEKDLHAITAISGSGPALVYNFLQVLEDTAILHGLSRELSHQLVQEMVKGALALSMTQKTSYQDLIQAITSPGGTTIVALSKLKKPSTFEYAIIEAITSAVKRSHELS